MKITLATLPHATEQEVFDQVAVLLLTQMEVCTSDGLRKCVYRAYRGDQTLMCAGGAIISDEEYAEQNMEGGNRFDVIGSWSALCGQEMVPIEHSDLIIRLQVVHDRRDVKNWELELRDLARYKNLNTHAIDALRCGTIELPGLGFTLWTIYPKFNAFKATEFSN